MATRRRPPGTTSPSDLLTEAVEDAVRVAKKAHKHSKSLASDNFYANKIAELRADAANAFRELSSRSAGDTTAMAEMIEAVFSPSTNQPERLRAARELIFSLKTTWRQSDTQRAPEGSDVVFPLAILSQAKRGYLITVGRQMNGCFSSGWYDACAVMMRRLVEISIIEAYEHKNIAHKIKDTAGNYLQLSELVNKALSENTWTLSRNTKKFLPELRDVGHISAHGRYYSARKEDIERVRQGCRVVVEEFLHHAGLL
jgi:hypothetical protein